DPGQRAGPLIALSERGARSRLLSRSLDARLAGTTGMDARLAYAAFAPSWRLASNRNQVRRSVSSMKSSSNWAVPRSSLSWATLSDLLALLTWHLPVGNLASAALDIARRTI